MSSLVVAVAVLFIFFAGCTTYEWYVRKDYRYWKLRVLYIASVNPAFVALMCTGGFKGLVAALLWFENIIVFFFQLKPLSNTYMPRRWREMMAPYMAYSISIAGIIGSIFYTKSGQKGSGSLFVLSFFAAIIITMYNIWEFVVIDKDYPEDNPYQEIPLVPLPEDKVIYTEAKKMGKWDLLAMFCLTAFSALVIFHNLGNTKAPQSMLDLSACDYHYLTAEADSGDVPCESKLDFEFGTGAYVESVYLYLGDKDDSVVRVEALSDEGNWIIIREALQLESTYRWNTIPIQMKTDAVRIIQRSGQGRYIEAAVRTKDYGLREKSKNLILPENASAYPTLFDEQELFPDVLTYYDQSLFDEVYYVSSMYQLLHGENMREQTHPPLGKAIMSLGMWLFGPTPFGWRFMSAFLGVLMVPIMYWFLHSYLHNTRYATAGTLLFCIDFLHITLARIGTLDTVVAFFLLLTMAVYYRTIEHIRHYEYDRVAFRWLFAFSVCIGICISLKWTGVFLLFGCVLAFFRCVPYSKKGWGIVMAYHGVLPGILYILSFTPFYAKMGYENVAEAAIRHSFDMLRFHETAMKGHEFASPWFTWMFDFRPLVDIVTYVEPDKVSTVATFGHPILWPVGLVCFLFVAFRAAYREDKRASFFATIYFGLIFPWFFIKRTTFIYQYYGCALVAIPIITYVMYRVSQRSKPVISKLFIGLCVAVFILFCPVITGEAISKTWIEQMLIWMQSWNFC